MFFLRSVGDYVSSYFPAYVGRQVIKSVRGELFAKYMHLPVTYYDRTSTAPMMSRLTYNVELVAEAATTTIVNLIRDSLTFIGLLVYLFYLNWQLASIIFLLAPPIAWLIRRINLLFRRYSARIQNSMGDITRVVEGRARRAAGHQVVQRAGLRDPPVRAGERA